MAIEFEGKSIETTQNGYLINIEDWSENLASLLASGDGIELGERHWDIIQYLRDEFINSAGNQPNTRTMIKRMSDQWGARIKSKDLYDLFPGDPSKQGGRIAGLPESRRKGGY